MSFGRGFRPGRLLQEIGSDGRHALRRLSRTPVFAAVVVSTLALAMGASLAIFNLIDRVLLRPLDVPHASRVFMFQRVTSPAGVEQRRTDMWPWDDYQRIRELRTLDAVAASGSRIEQTLVSLVDGALGELLPAVFVSADYLRVFGSVPGAGRDFDFADEQPGAPLVALLGHRFWRTRFQADSAAIGRTIRINNQPVVVVGVAPATFPGTRIGAPAPDIVLPLTAAPRVLPPQAGRDAASPVRPINSFAVVARLTAEMERDQLEAEASSVLGDSLTGVLPVAEALVPFESRQDLSIFLGLLGVAVAVTMLIGAANAAGLLVARVDRRRPELAICAALGAGRWRLTRALAIETWILALTSGVASLIVARWIANGFSTLALPGGIAVSSLRSGVDARTLALAVVLALATAFAIALVPVLRCARGNLALEVRRQSGSSPARGTAGIVLGVQIALCIVLVSGAGLFVRSLSSALSTDLGFNSSGLISASVTAPPPRRGFQMAEFKALDPFLDSVRRMPGVSYATLGPLPLVHGSDMSIALVEIDGRPLELETPLDVLLVDAQYFTTLGQPVVRGRDFTLDDSIGQSAVAIVNETAARTFWPDDDPTYRNVKLPPGLDAAVVGVVRDAKLRGLDGMERPALYVVRSQALSVSAMFQGMSAARGVTLIVRSGQNRSSLVSALNRAAGDVGLSVAGVGTVEDAIAGLVMPQRLGRTLLSGLGLTALIVTLVGVYGFVSGVVTRRTREFGVRLALGASAADVLYATMKSTTVMVAGGLAAGLAITWSAGRFVERFLYGISPADPATFIAAAALIAGTALVAALVPALRALRIDPVRVLRSE